ncbi:MAG: threonylcarbamoyl-AMP synthase [Bacteroidales bacterium]|jgi:L-threonylcarbamoyladenylate synthase|nr:threonylcarbamoyl-AMP synthase [Bacteroidales bacterium]
MLSDIENSIKALSAGGVILYPTDTVWGLGCDMSQPKALARIFVIKNIHSARSLIILVNSTDMLQEYAEDIPEIAFDLIQNAARPLTIIYPKARGPAKNVAAEDGSIAIRVIKHKFCCELINVFGKPLTSTSANLHGESASADFKLINPKLINAVDYVVPQKYDEHNEVKASQIIKINSSSMFEIIRK